MADAWQRLVTRARRAPDERGVEMPSGFDTRVLAALRRLRPSQEDEDRLILLVLRRVLYAGVAVAALSVLLNLGALTEKQESLDPAHAVVMLSYLE